MYEKRFYRDLIKGKDLVYYNVTIGETDLYIGTSDDRTKEVKSWIIKYRNQIESYIKDNPFFLTSLHPVQVDEKAPEIIKKMSEASFIASVGPMASVAGALSEMIGKNLLDFSNEVIVENGGDIFLNINTARTIGIYAGKNSVFNNLGIKIDSNKTPMGVCTSAGKIGHSFSMGNADAVIVLSKSTFLADALATSVGNKVRTRKDINNAIEYAKTIENMIGTIIIVDDEIGIWGDIELEVIKT